MLVLVPPWSLQYLPEEEGGFPLQPQFCDATTTGVDVAGETPPKRPQVSEILKSRLAAKEKKKKRRISSIYYHTPQRLERPRGL